MMPSCDHVGTPAGFDGLTHLASSETSGSAALMSVRTCSSVSWRQSLPATSAAPRLVPPRGEGALHPAVPLHARDRAAPPRLHVAQRRLMGRVAVGDDRSEVAVLCLD